MTERSQNSMTKLQQVIVIRKDLNMRKGKMVAQSVHASMKAVIGSSMEYGLAKSPQKEDFRCNPKSVYGKAKLSGFICALIEDSGLTEFDGVPTLTCCAIGPATKEELQSITGHLKLL